MQNQNTARGDATVLDSSNFDIRHVLVIITSVIVVLTIPLEMKYKNHPLMICFGFFGAGVLQGGRTNS
jgi:hypothetical protein